MSELVAAIIDLMSARSTVCASPVASRSVTPFGASDSRRPTIVRPSRVCTV